MEHVAEAEDDDLLSAFVGVLDRSLCLFGTWHMSRLEPAMGVCVFALKQRCTRERRVLIQARLHTKVRDSRHGNALFRLLLESVRYRFVRSRGVGLLSWRDR